MELSKETIIFVIDMRSYKEYYDLSKEHELIWKSRQTEEWWKKKPFNDGLELTGDYIETIKELDENEKNDSSLFRNHTNVLNSEWGILFNMLGQVLVDWCVENNETNRWSFMVSINRVVDGLDDVYVCQHKVKTIIKDSPETDVDKKVLKKFEDCRNVLCDIIWDFIYKHKNDLPCDWNCFVFSLDDLQESCKYGQWVAASDGYMCLSNVDMDGDGDQRDEFVLCM